MNFRNLWWNPAVFASFQLRQANEGKGREFFGELPGENAGLSVQKRLPTLCSHRE